MKSLTERLEAKTDVAVALRILARAIGATTDKDALASLIHASAYLVKSVR